MPVRHRLLAPEGFSFPSGHSTGSFAFAAFVATFRPRFAPLLFAVAAAIAWSRVVLGVHYPSDVTGGAILGSLAGWGTARLYLRLHPRAAPLAADVPTAAAADADRAPAHPTAPTPSADAPARDDAS